MKYFCLTAGVFNTVVSLSLVYLAAQTTMTDQILWLFVLNIVCATFNIASWFILSLTEICDVFPEMS